jgi:hypothetical protein
MDTDNGTVGVKQSTEKGTKTENKQQKKNEQSKQ